MGRGWGGGVSIKRSDKRHRKWRDHEEYVDLTSKSIPSYSKWSSSCHHLKIRSKNEKWAHILDIRVGGRDLPALGIRNRKILIGEQRDSIPQTCVHRSPGKLSVHEEWWLYLFKKIFLKKVFTLIKIFLSHLWRRPENQAFPALFAGLRRINPPRMEENTYFRFFLMFFHYKNPVTRDALITTRITSPTPLISFNLGPIGSTSVFLYWWNVKTNTQFHALRARCLPNWTQFQIPFLWFV